MCEVGTNNRRGGMDEEAIVFIGICRCRWDWWSVGVDARMILG